jgi:DNA invertase Pin-like site-specific DNA recombinase
MRVSTLDQHPETQFYDLHEMAKQRGYRIVEEYEDRISEGRHIGRKALVLDRAAILRDRQQGHSLGQLAKSYLVSRTTIHRVLGEQIPAVTKGLEKPAA